LKMVGDRDGWRCHLCGGRVRSDLSGSQELGPTIDHLVPVSAGGRDELVNVALAHRRCNVARGNRGEVQLRLLG
jgi:5-methylcytosine-specific restriction endonuclease McrA